MNWRKPTEEEISLYKKLSSTCLVPDRWGNPVVSETLVENAWVESGRSKADLVNTFANLRCKAIMEIEENDIIQMSTRKEIPDCYRIAEISFEDNRIRFFQTTRKNVPFEKMWPITRYPYLGIERKNSPINETKEEKRNKQTGLF